MTLNVAHGRKRGPHQALQRTKSIKSNLDDVGALLLRHQPDLVALQEADGPSVLTGKFDHVQHIAECARYEYAFRGEHAKGKRLCSGTALLCSQPLQHPQSVKFAPSPPTFSKGFVRATLDWPGNADGQVDVVSVHFDFSRKSVRRKQARELIRNLADRPGPPGALVVVGDFNCQWKDKTSPLHTLADELDLHAYRPDAAGLTTFPRLRRRLDWVLISPALTFASHTVLRDRVSDHRAVLVELALEPVSK